MPVPQPKKDEQQQDYVSRCISVLVTDGTVDNTDKGRKQAAAICFQTWRDSKKAMLQPMAGENHADFIKRCKSQVGADDPKDAETICELMWQQHGKAAKDNKPYGDVAYADPGYQEDGKARYPIDTEEHIRAAWNYINKPENQKPYSADQVAKIKARIIAAWKDKIDPKGPPGAMSMTSLNRAYSVIDVKSVNAERRLLHGVATTPTADRLGDVVDPKGVRFKNPLPLLWQHQHDQPVGWAIFADANERGIEFEAQMPEVAEAGKLRDRVNEAWQSVKLGLVRGVSIGFRALQFDFLEKGGIHFQQTEVIELSLVTIPANMEATITSIRAMDTVAVASDQRLGSGGRIISPASRKPISSIPAKEKAMPRTIAEQISAFEAKRAAIAARGLEIMNKANEESRTLEQAEKEEYDTAQQEIKDIDEHLCRLRTADSLNRTQLKKAGEENDPHAVNLPGNSGRVISVKSSAPPGTGFIRLCIAEAYGKGDTTKAVQRAQAYSDMPELAEIMRIGIRPLMEGAKAAVGAGTTTDATWASPLVTFQVMVDQFIQLLRPATIIGRIPGLRQVPFNIQMPSTTTGTSVAWVGENAPKPVSSMAFSTVTLRWAKAAGIVILTDELVRFSNPSAEAVVRSDLIAAMAQFLDRQFVDPSVAAVTNVSPASITNGVSAIVPTGTNEAAFRADVRTLFNTFLNANLTTAGGVWIMTQRQALALSLMVNALGQQSFPTINGDGGGTLLGYPVVASENIPATTGSPAEGFPIIFALAPEIMLADDGQTVIDASNQASVQLDTAPDSPPGAATAYISLWQMNMTGLRCERWINWLKRRATAVSYIQSALYG